MYIIPVFFTGYHHTNKNLTCSAYAYSDLKNNQECHHAVIYASSFNSFASYKGSGSWKYNPKGCYIYDNGYVYFNSHSTGSRKPNTQSICKKGNSVSNSLFSMK